MSEQPDKLLRCFASVFPSLQSQELPAASTQSLEAWDSLATVTLAALVEQEFGVEVNLLDLAELTSFAAFQNYIDRRSRSRPGVGGNGNQ